MGFKPKRILMKTFVESQFMVMYVYQFLTKVNSYENICLVSAWSYLSLRVTTKTEALWRHLLSLSLKLCKFNSFKQNRTSIKTFVELQFEVMLVHEFQTKAISYEGICWVSVWSYLSLRGLNKSEFLWRHLLSFSLKLCKFMRFNKSEFCWINLLTLSLNLCRFMSFKQKGILMKTFVQSQFEVI